MTVASIDLQLAQGEDFSQTYTWMTGTPPALVNLTSASGARMMIRDVLTDPATLLSITTTGNSQGSIVLGGALGTIAVTITKAATSAMPAPLRAVYDLFIDFAVGTSTRFLSGYVVIAPYVTHP